MKKINVLMLTGIILVLTMFKASAQEATMAKASIISPYHLAITYNKTTNLVFPFAIKSVDKGSRDILAQKALGVENVLQIKAAKMGFAETNLTVVTADGSFFAYVLNYTDSPADLSYQFSNSVISPKQVVVFTKDATTDEVQKNAGVVENKERIINNIRDEDNDIVVDVKGIYIHNDVIYFQLSLKNNSSVNYDVQSLRFYIQDKKRIKRTAEQEIDMQPLFLLGNANLIQNASEQVITVALPKFTIPDKKYLAVQLMEKNGGRHLSLRIKSKVIIHARLI